MLFESILIFLALGTGILFIGIPSYKLVKSLIPRKIDPVKDAQERLEIARKELEAAHLNKEAEKLYNKMYQEALEDEVLDTEQISRSKK